MRRKEGKREERSERAKERTMQRKTENEIASGQGLASTVSFLTTGSLWVLLWCLSSGGLFRKSHPGLILKETAQPIKSTENVAILTNQMFP